MGGGGGGGGGVHEYLRHVMPSTECGRGVWWWYPPRIFVRFEDSLLGNKPGKSEGQ